MLHAHFFLLERKKVHLQEQCMYIPIPLFFGRRAFIIVFNNSSWSTVLFFCVSRYRYFKQLSHVLLSPLLWNQKNTHHILNSVDGCFFGGPLLTISSTFSLSSSSSGFSHMDNLVVGLKKNIFSSPVHTTHQLVPGISWLATGLLLSPSSSWFSSFTESSLSFSSSAFTKKCEWNTVSYIA